jgi:hypothetical protein
MTAMAVTASRRRLLPGQYGRVQMMLLRPSDMHASWPSAWKRNYRPHVGVCIKVPCLRMSPECNSVHNRITESFAPTVTVTCFSTNLSFKYRLLFLVMFVWFVEGVYERVKCILRASVHYFPGMDSFLDFLLNIIRTWAWCRRPSKVKCRYFCLYYCYVYTR